MRRNKAKSFLMALYLRQWIETTQRQVNTLITGLFVRQWIETTQRQVIGKLLTSADIFSLHT